MTFPRGVTSVLPNMWIGMSAIFASSVQTLSLVKRNVRGSLRAHRPRARCPRCGRGYTRAQERVS